MYDLLCESFAGHMTKYHKNIQAMGSSVGAIAPVATGLCQPDSENRRTYNQLLISLNFGLLYFIFVYWDPNTKKLGQIEAMVV